MLATVTKIASDKTKNLCRVIHFDFINFVLTET